MLWSSLDPGKPPWSAQTGYSIWVSMRRCSRRLLKMLGKRKQMRGVQRYEPRPLSSTPPSHRLATVKGPDEVHYKGETPVITFSQAALLPSQMVAQPCTCWFLSGSWRHWLRLFGSRCLLIRLHEAWPFTSHSSRAYLTSVSRISLVRSYGCATFLMYSWSLSSAGR
jgi:hypothetical protein